MAVRIAIKGLEINPILEEIIQEYILVGVDYEKRSPRRFLEVKRGYGISMSGPWFDHTDLQIQPGARMEDVISFIKTNWLDIERIFKKSFPERYGGRIKIKKNRDRDKSILQLFEISVLRRNGSFHDKNAIKFLKERGVEDLPSAKSFSKAGYDLPQIEARKKVIENMLKLKDW